MLLAVLLSASGLLTGCAAVGRVPTLGADNYQLVRTNDPALAATVGKDRDVYVKQVQDTLQFLSQPPKDSAAPRRFSYSLRRGQHVIFAGP